MLEYAVSPRDVRHGHLIHHSYRGSTYTAVQFAYHLSEELFSTLKTGLVNRNLWKTKEDAETGDGWIGIQDLFETRNPGRIRLS